MRSRVALISLALAASALAAPLLVHAASIPFFGPIIDNKLQECAALGWGAVMIVVNNIIRLLITLTIVFVAPLMIAYAGFLLVVNPVNPSGKEKARKMILNLIIGLIIALAAWLIVDAIMATLYNGAFGSWYNIITTGGQAPCLALATQLNPAAAPSLGGAPAFPGSPLGAGPIQNASGSCTAAALGPFWGAKAAAMSCVTHYEDSTCNPLQSSGTDIGSDGTPVSIGIFQINLSAPQGDLAQYPACTTASGGTPLHCNQAFAGGTYTAQNHATHVADIRLYQKCVDAISNLNCSNQAANAVLASQGLSGWGSRAQQNCSSLLASNSGASGQQMLTAVLVSVSDFLNL